MDQFERHAEAGSKRRIFTELVRALTAEEEESQDRLETLLPEVLSALRSAAVRELKRRGLWHVPPRYLGFSGRTAWEAPGAEPDALDELVSACYEANFVSRLGALQRHLNIKENIDGLVFLNIKNTIHTLQARNDPVGSRTFDALRSAVRMLEDSGDLKRTEGSPEILNDTRLDFRSSTPAPRRDGVAIEEIVQDWCDQLLPGLITARGTAAHREIVTRLAAQLKELGTSLGRALRLGELVEPLRTAVRQRWASVLKENVGRAALGTDEASASHPRFEHLAQQYRPDRRIELWDSFHKLTECVSVALERESPQRAAAHLQKLWEYLRVYACDPGEKLPSRRRLASLLGIPRARLPELYATLGRWIDRCRRQLAAGTDFDPLGSSS